MQLAAITQAQDIGVLMIEDSAGDATAITKALVVHDDLFNFRVTRMKTLAKGLSYLEENDVDVTLLDLGLPDARDLESVNEIHSHFPDVPIVIISGYFNADLTHRALQSGAQEFLIKGECSNVGIRQSVYQAIARKKIERAYKTGEKLP